LASISDKARGGDANVVVNFEHLFDGFRDDQSAHDALVTDKNNTVTELESCGGCSPLHGLTCIFNLEQSSVWAKGGDAVVVSSSAWLHFNSLIFSVESTLYEDEGSFS
jgi:hypothetical protein